jgi:pimeloyl-ACP methyl ester carboxylesterase
VSSIFTITAETLSTRKIPTLTVERENANSQRPRVIVLHGLYGTKESYLQELYLLACAGFRATAIDLALHGKRTNASSLMDLITTDYLGAMQTIILESAADISALLDLWQDSQLGVGLYGVSIGGMVSHAAVSNDPRITALSAIITTPDWSTADPARSPPAGSDLAKYLENISPVNRYKNYAPCAVLMIVGDEDVTLTPTGSKLLFSRLSPIYTENEIESRLELKIIEDVGHSYTPEMREMSIKWLQTHLRQKNT